MKYQLERALKGHNTKKECPRMESMFDPELFRRTPATGPINANKGSEKPEEVMKKVVDACAATMLRKRTRNRHPLLYWWNTALE